MSDKLDSTEAMAADFDFSQIVVPDKELTFGDSRPETKKQRVSSDKQLNKNTKSKKMISNKDEERKHKRSRDEDSPLEFGDSRQSIDFEIHPTKFVDIVMQQMGSTDHLAAINAITQLSVEQRGILLTYMFQFKNMPLKTLTKPTSRNDPAFNKGRAEMLAIILPSASSTIECTIPQHAWREYLFKRFPKDMSVDTDSHVMCGSSKLVTKIGDSLVDKSDYPTLIRLLGATLKFVECPADNIRSIRCILAGYSTELVNGALKVKYNGDLIDEFYKSQSYYGQILDLFNRLSGKQCTDTFMWKHFPVEYIYIYKMIRLFTVPKCPVDTIPAIPDIKALLVDAQGKSETAHARIMKRQIDNKKKRRSTDSYIWELDYNYPVHFYDRVTRRCACIKTLIGNGVFNKSFTTAPHIWEDGTDVTRQYIDFGVVGNISETDMEGKLKSLSLSHVKTAFLSLPLMPHTTTSLKILAHFLCEEKFSSYRLELPFQAHERQMIIRIDRGEVKDYEKRFNFNGMIIMAAPLIRTFLVMCTLREMYRMDNAEFIYMARIATGIWEYSKIIMPIVKLNFDAALAGVTLGTTGELVEVETIRNKLKKKKDSIK